MILGLPIEVSHFIAQMITDSSRPLSMDGGRWTVDGLLVGRGAGNGCFRPLAVVGWHDVEDKKGTRETGAYSGSAKTTFDHPPGRFRFIEE